MHYTMRIPYQKNPLVLRNNVYHKYEKKQILFTQYLLIVGAGGGT